MKDDIDQWKKDDRCYHDIVANDIYDKTSAVAWDYPYEQVTINEWMDHMKKETRAQSALDCGCGTGER